MPDCGITGCSEPKVGSVEMVSIYILHPFSINICQTHRDEILKLRGGRITIQEECEICGLRHRCPVHGQAAQGQRISGWPPGDSLGWPPKEGGP